jgi:hypothetical protein
LQDADNWLQCRQHWLKQRLKRREQCRTDDCDRLPVEIGQVN